MLEPVREKGRGDFMDFSSITTYSTGTGMCYVYNVVMKATKSGKPFITLYLRDVNGNAIPGYVFDLKSPLMAGQEAAKVSGKIVRIDWQENYLRNVGLTLILDAVAIVESTTVDDYALFCGTVKGLNEKYDYLQSLFVRELNIKVGLPAGIKMSSSPAYFGGRQGGLVAHYAQMGKLLETIDVTVKEERRQMFVTFLLFILAHSAYVRACDNDEANIDLVTNLTERISSLSKQLKAGTGSLELVHQFFGYTPKDIYVRTVSHISDTAHRLEKEFALYRTIPLSQEGNAGYGIIRRYQLEESC